MRRFWVGMVIADLLILASCGGGTSASTSPPPTGGGGSGQVTLQSIQISPSTASIAQGTTQPFTAKGTYSDGTTKDLTTTAQWSCLLPNVATVSSSAPTQGLAAALLTNNGSPATVLITASSGSVSNSATLAIKSSNVTVSSVAVTPAAATIGFLNQQQLTATATFSDGSTQDVTNLTSWNASPLLITNTGLAIGTSVGTYTLAASFGGAPPPTTLPTLTVDLSNLVSVAILPSSPILANRTQLTFSVIGTFNDGSTRDVSSLATNWSASDPTVAVPFGSAPGNFKGMGAGTAMITTSVGTFTPSATLTVSDATLQSLTVSPATATIAPTTTMNYTALGTFSDGSTQDLSSLVKWSSSSPSVKVAKSKVTGESAGSTIVNAASPAYLGSVQGSATITITSATLQSIAVTPATVLLPPAGALTYSATGTFSDGSTQDVTTPVAWKSSADSVATVDSNLAMGEGAGQSTITATLSGISATANLTVVFPQQVSMSITPATAQVAAGSTTQLTATGTFIDGTTQDFTTLVNWSSSSPTNATVGYQTGLVSGLASGASTITATLGSVTGTAKLTVP
jgi:uncharacterized protein YjdB